LSWECFLCWRNIKKASVASQKEKRETGVCEQVNSEASRGVKQVFGYMRLEVLGKVKQWAKIRNNRCTHDVQTDDPAPLVHIEKRRGTSQRFEVEQRTKNQQKKTERIV